MSKTVQIKSRRRAKICPEILKRCPEAMAAKMTPHAGNTSLNCVSFLPQQLKRYIRVAFRVISVSVVPTPFPDVFSVTGGSNAFFIASVPLYLNSLCNSAGYITFSQEAHCLPNVRMYEFESFIRSSIVGVLCCLMIVPHLQYTTLCIFGLLNIRITALAIHMQTHHRTLALHINNH